jgi:hypothetical protein
MVLGGTVFAAPAPATALVGPAKQIAQPSANAPTIRGSFIRSVQNLGVTGPDNIVYHPTTPAALQMQKVASTAIANWCASQGISGQVAVATLYVAPFNPVMKEPLLQASYLNLFNEMYLQYGTGIYNGMTYCIRFYMSSPDKLGTYSKYYPYVGFCNADGSYYCISYESTYMAIPSFICYYDLICGNVQTYSFY